jgi:IclR family transcriptional regulator, acetate operon repressor
MEHPTETLTVRRGLLARRASSAPGDKSSSGATETVDLSLRLLERLAASREALGVSDLAREFGTSKTKVHRHLQTLARHAFVRQDAPTRRYEAGIKLFMLGERLRERFDILTAGRDDMARLRDETGQAVTLSTLGDDQVVVLELFHGRAIVEFGTRPGTVLDLHASAHGKVALAFGPAGLFERCVAKPLKAWTPQTLCSRAALERAVAEVRKRGWAIAPNQVLTGVNGLAAPIFDHRGDYAGAIAIAGSVQHITATPSPAQIRAVVAAARGISKKMGWPGR